MLFSLQVPVVKRIAALGAELRRMCRISRFPAALVAFVLRNAGRLGFAAFGAELALIHRAAAARPAVCLYFWLFVPHSGQNFPVAVAPHCGHFQLPAAGFGSGFCCRSSGRNFR